MQVQTFFSSGALREIGTFLSRVEIGTFIFSKLAFRKVFTLYFPFIIIFIMFIIPLSYIILMGTQINHSISTRIDFHFFQLWSIPLPWFIKFLSLKTSFSLLLAFPNLILGISRGISSSSFLTNPIMNTLIILLNFYDIYLSIYLTLLLVLRLLFSFIQFNFLLGLLFTFLLIRLSRTNK